jgi:CheY-like chemotaxis protein
LPFLAESRMKTPDAILLVEDNEDDVFLMQRALKRAGIINPVQLAEDGRIAIDYLSGSGKFSDRAAYPVPKAVFLDLKLPIKDGFEVLSWIRSQPELKEMPVIILSSSSEPADVDRAAELGSNSYMVKPPTGPGILNLAKMLNWDWLKIQPGASFGKLV